MTRILFTYDIHNANKAKYRRLERSIKAHIEDQCESKLIKTGLTTTFLVNSHNHTTAEQFVEDVLGYVENVLLKTPQSNLCVTNSLGSNVASFAAIAEDATENTDWIVVELVAIPANRFCFGLTHSSDNIR